MESDRTKKSTGSTIISERACSNVVLANNECTSLPEAELPGPPSGRKLKWRPSSFFEGHGSHDARLA